MTNRIYISVGSNIDPHVYIKNAREQLFAQLQNPLMSPVYQSPAVGMTGPDFLNAVIGGDTNQSVELSLIHI